MLTRERFSITERNELSFLEHRVEKLRLGAGQTMRDSVMDFYERVSSHAGCWSPDEYPTGSEKELYPKFAHILLSGPKTTIPALLDLYATVPARKLRLRVLDGRWRAYRVSTMRRDLGSRGKKVKGPLIFPGGCGERGITDVVLLLNPFFGDDSKQIQADLLLYFELKSRDSYPQNNDQLAAHLKAISMAKNAFLGCVGGRAPNIQRHARWLGHVTLGCFLDAMSRVAETKLRNLKLAHEIEQSCKQRIAKR